MKFIKYLFILLPLIALSQNEKSFHLKDIIYLKNSEGQKVDDFLKSRLFKYVGVDERAYHYALNYDVTTKRATIWCYKYFDGNLKVIETNGGNLLMNIKSQLKDYKIDFEYEPDGWTLTSYYYKKFAIYIRENNVLDRYELYM